MHRPRPYQTVCGVPHEALNSCNNLAFLASQRAAWTDFSGLGLSEGAFGPQQCSQHPKPQPDMGSAAGDGERAQWIVRFTSYRMIADHEASLAVVLASLSLNKTAAERGSVSEGSGCSRSADGNGSGDGTGECAAQQPWQWVHRRNKATAHPTDFGLLSCAPDAAEVVKVGFSCGRWSRFLPHW